MRSAGMPARPSTRHTSHSSSSFVQATTIAGVLWLVAFLVLYIRELRAADELEWRIQGEAPAIA